MCAWHGQVWFYWPADRWTVQQATLCPLPTPCRMSLFALTSASCSLSIELCSIPIPSPWVRPYKSPKIHLSIFVLFGIYQANTAICQGVNRKALYKCSWRSAKRRTHVSLSYALLLRGRCALIVSIAQFKLVPHSWCQWSFSKSQLRFHLSTFTHGNFCISYNKLCRGMLLKNCTLHGTQ